MSPANNSIIAYDTHIDLTANYKMIYNEKSTTFTLGWKVIREKGKIDITEDVIKSYYNTSLLKVHLDRNVLEPNNYYKIIFFVKGNDTFYRGMYQERVHRVLLGLPPKPGRCISNLAFGFADLTNFVFSAPDWTDSNLLKSYNFYFSFDDGEIFIPIAKNDPLNITIEY